MSKQYHGHNLITLIWRVLPNDSIIHLIDFSSFCFLIHKCSTDMKIKPLAKNRKARFEYDIQKTFEAGIVLKGTEVKSIRSGQINLAESYCRVDEKMQVYLLNAHISHYDYGNRNNHEPLRPRRLLLHRSEIRRLYGQLKEQGLTLIPLKIYLKDGLIKLELAIGRGKKIHDKRQNMKKREAQRDVARALSERS